MITDSGTRDVNGNLTVLGKAVARHDFRPFGEEIFGRPAGIGYGMDASVQQKFTGKERDAETGLDYFGARYMSSAEGRFTSPDEFQGGIVDPFTGMQVGQPGPLPYAEIADRQTLNKYVYVRNNPLRFIDLNGHCIWDLCLGEGAAAYTAGTAAVAGAAYLLTPQGKQG